MLIEEENDKENEWDVPGNFEALVAEEVKYQD